MCILRLEVRQRQKVFEAASTFFQIAEIEHTHQERFQKIAEMLENGTYYSREEQGRWICTNCGYIHDGKQAPSVCPVCRHEKDIFFHMNMHLIKEPGNR